MDPQHALADLAEISSQIEAAAILDGDGSVAASTFADAARAAAVGTLAGALLGAASQAVAPGGEVVQLEAATAEGSVFLVRDGGRSIVAVTRPVPTVGLVFYDLKSALRSCAPQAGGAV
jgi:predicted regulator of Ras-like GTPase activity (Roadblock/LC7/MglB family)